MIDETGSVGATVALDLTASETETVVEALKLLLAGLERDDADQIAEIERLLARLPEDA